MCDKTWTETARHDIRLATQYPRAANFPDKYRLLWLAKTWEKEC
jgi:hypothetical protein